MRIIRLTELEYSMLETFIETAGSYDSVQDAFSEKAAELLGHEEPQNLEQEEQQIDAEVELMNRMFAAIGEAEQVEDPKPE